MAEETQQFVSRLHRALDAHDLDGLVACFAPAYRNETPAHPSRGFQGRAQVRLNWVRLFEAIPDMRATVVRWVATDDTVWTEWKMEGTRPSGQPHQMAGVIIFGVIDGRAVWARFYLEPVDAGGGTVDDAIGRIIEGDRT